MTHYDHAIAMSLKLDRWSEDRPLRNFELEALACQQRTKARMVKKQSLFDRCLSVFGFRDASSANRHAVRQDVDENC